MQLFGLVGRNISYSFSRKFFSEKFTRLRIDATYENFDIEDISRLPEILSSPQLRGFNVTIPYKEEVIPYLDNLSADAAAIGAVNTVRVEPDASLTGHNTDWIGFYLSLLPMLDSSHKSALVLGTGGASKAVAYALAKLEIAVHSVSRTGNLTYGNLKRIDFPDPLIIVNCTPLGTFPNIGASPPLPEDFFRPGDIAYDLIYNPAETQFLKTALMAGARTQNGLRMLEIQAEKSWEIWNG